MTRAIQIGAIACLSAFLTASACSLPTRTRLLNFFFDGVPPPGTVVQRGYRIGGQPLPDIPTPQLAKRPRVAVYSHAPFRENRCGACHNPLDGNLFRTAEEGLCATCHADLTREPQYVHGPVAVNACAFCHHHHNSEYPKLLLAEPVTLCLKCHQMGDLSEVPGHAPDAPQGCVDCHHAHGGDDPYFLRSAEP